MPHLLSNLLGAFLLLLMVMSLGSDRARWILLYVLIYMTMAGVQLDVPVLGSGMRSFIAFLLLLSSWPTVSHGMARLDRKGILRPATALSAYLLLSHLILCPTPNFKSSFEIVGNYIFFVLLVSFLLKGPEKRVHGLVGALALGLSSNVASYMPAWVPFLQGREILGPLPHYQEPASSAMLLLPMMLMALSSARGRGRKALILAGLAFLTVATFYTGARAPLAVYVLILAFYRRRVLWTAFVVLAGVAGFLAMPRSTQTERTISRIEQLATAAQTGSLSQNPDAEMRIQNIGMAWEGFQERPFLGWGVGSWYGFRQERSGQLGYNLSIHNGWALLIFELGLVGLLLYLFFAWKCVKGVSPKFRGIISRDVGYIGLLQVASTFLVSMGGDALLVRATYGVFALAAYSRCAEIDLAAAGAA
jgi:O-antigen ligase